MTKGSKTLSASIICIVATEFCERFSFCGLRTILSIYLRNELCLTENQATVVYHVFIMVSYTIPLAGAICADSYIGKFRTILYFSFVYLTGNILMCIAAVCSLEFSKYLVTPIGLCLIAVGTGGIKPCVAAFGGDQFYLPDQQADLQSFFSMFYFSINLGGFVGMILTPILRKGVSCFGCDTCYPLGFGFPALLMIIGIVLFWLGKPWYRIKIPKENVILDFMKCTSYAVGNKCKTKPKQNIYWLDYAADRFPKKLITDMKTVFAVLFLFLPIPIFWSLFDQQGSRWTFQASHMKGDIFSMEILPDQMQVINPTMVLVMIPIFDKFLNPWCVKRRCLDNSLHRMAIGGIIAGFAFLAAGILELDLEKTYPELPDKRHASMFFINTLPCDLKILNQFNGVKNISSRKFAVFKNMPAQNKSSYAITVQVPFECGNTYFIKPDYQFSIKPLENQVDIAIIGVSQPNAVELFVTDPVDFKKSLTGRARLRLAYMKNADGLHNITVSLQNNGFQDVYFVQDTRHPYLATSGYMELSPGSYECVVRSNGNEHVLDKTFELEFGGIYALIIRENHKTIEFSHLYTMAIPNTVNILWLIPQYFFISVSEIMFAVAGLEFAFLQAPKSMKTVTIAGWYLSVAVGNLLVIIITQANFFRSQANEFFLFAVLIVADMMIFMEIASKYKFVQLEADSSIHLFRGEEAPLIGTESEGSN